MARKRLKASLSVSSIENLRKELKKYRDSIEDKANLVAEKLSEMGAEIARVQITELDAIFTGELIANIYSEKRDTNKHGVVFCVVADSKHAAFVEFGTGIVGQQSPYPYPLPEGVSWEYASGKTIHQLADGRYGWFYKSDSGQWYFTEGMESRPFMYNTSLELQKKVIKVVREVFRQ